jgi:hypothetical protein
MKKLNNVLALAGVAVVLTLSAGQLFAQDQQPQRQRGQGGGNFDPEQMRQRMMDRYKEQLEVKDEAEWKLISDRIEKVTTARREIGFGGGFGGFGGRGGRGGPGGGGGGGGQGGDNAQAARRAFGGEPSAEVQALQKAIDAKAPADEIKTKLAKVREARKDKEAKLEKAQDDLRKVLTTRQEASAVLAGLLK